MLTIKRIPFHIINVYSGGRLLTWSEAVFGTNLPYVLLSELKEPEQRGQNILLDSLTILHVMAQVWYVLIYFERMKGKVDFTRI